ERTLKHIIPFITEKLYLKINLEKTTVNHISKVKYLGYSFYRYKGKCRMRVHPKSIEKMKNRLRELTVRGNKWSNPEREEKLRRYTTNVVNLRCFIYKTTYDFIGFQHESFKYTHKKTTITKKVIVSSFISID